MTKSAAANERFGASGGVARPTQSVGQHPRSRPNRSNTPACRQAADTLAASVGRQCVIEQFHNKL